ncbi:MAG: hypothetical protein FWD32_02025 [Firmicutes bacterium]|nr:hypothetical protein [Bacillota bacterium]
METKTNNSFWTVLVFILTMLLIANMLIAPTVFYSLTVGGLTLFFTRLVPVLFPFFVLCGIVTQVAGKNSVWLGALCGTPASAKIILDLYNQNKLNKNQAHSFAKMLSNPSPAFILGVVPNGLIVLFCVLTSSAILCISHISQILKAPKFQKLPKTAQSKTLSISQIFNTSIKTAINNILIVGGFVVMFFIFTKTLSTAFPALWILTGFFEITCGVASTNNIFVLTAITAFGGLCIAMQNFIFLADTGLKFSNYIIFKVLQTAIAVALCFIVCTLLYNA